MKTIFDISLTMKVFAAMLFMTVMPIQAQKLEPVHDESVFNQFTTAQFSYGNLQPQVWYKVNHKEYYKTAHAPEKGITYLRSQAAIRASQQVAMSDSIDSVLVKRRDVELLNVADRMVDMTWVLEKDKIEPLIAIFRDNMNHIMLYGGTRSDFEEWEQILKSIEDGLDGIKNAYLPNGKRHSQYLRIFDDLKNRNYHLLLYLQQLKNAQDISKLAEPRPKFTRADRVNVARQAHGRWIMAGKSVK